MAAIKKYINTNYEVDMAKRAPFIRRGLKNLVDENVLTQVKGSYKIAKVKKPENDNKSGIWRIVEPFPEESGPYPYWENPPWNFQDDAEKGQGSSGLFKVGQKSTSNETNQVHEFGEIDLFDFTKAIISKSYSLDNKRL